MDVITHLYLQIKSNPALWLVLTLSSYIFGQWLFRVAKFNPLFSPIIVAVVTTMCVLLLCGVPYEQYFAGAQFIHFLLGPATVALAVPIYEQRLRLRLRVLCQPEKRGMPEGHLYPRRALPADYGVLPAELH